MKCKFKDIVNKKDGFLRGPFGGDLKKSMFVPYSANCYKVYEQGVVLQQDKDVGKYYISKEYFSEKMSKFEVSPNDFLISCSGVNYGAIYQLPQNIKKGIINQALLRVRLNNEVVDYNYFYYYFKAYIAKKITGGSGDSTIPNFPPMDVVKNIDIEIPPIWEQREIGKILQGIDKKIAVNNKINEELEKLAKTLYDYWFVQFDFPDENGKPYKSSGGKMIWNDELKREIPKDCELKHVKDFLDVVTGKEDANFARQDGQYAFFTCGDEILKCKQSAFMGKSILIAGNGNFNIKYFEGKFNAYQRTYVLIPKEEVYIGVIYLSALNRMSAFTRGSNGSIVKFITKGDVENIPVILPKNKSILNFLNRLLDTQNLIRQEIENLKNLRDFLLPMLMNGQVTAMDSNG